MIVSSSNLSQLRNRNSHDSERVIEIFSGSLPAIPLREAAGWIEDELNVKINFDIGPPSSWLSRVKAGQGDILMVGAEYMMDDIEAEGLILKETRKSLGYRKAVILVRKGNPKNIRSLEDLCGEEVKILVCGKVCQKGLWDDIASKAGLTDKIRRNIVEYARGCVQMLHRWLQSEGEIDAAIGWNTYKNMAPESFDVIELPKDLQILRSANIAVTRYSKKKELAKRFIELATSERIREIYRKHGWIV